MKTSAGVSRLGVRPEEAASDKYADLLESVARPIGDATAPDKRAQFRDLVNGARVAPRDRDWESARVAGALIEKVDPPGFAILALFTAASETGAIGFSIEPMSEARVLAPATKIGSSDTSYPLHYDWAVIELSVGQLRELNLIWTGDTQHEGWSSVQLTARRAAPCEWAAG